MTLVNIIESSLKDAYIFEPRVFADKRGYFFESYQQEKYKEVISSGFVQDNFSKSQRDVLRGLHFQMNTPQGKLVSVISGEVFDVAVDLRPNSPTFGKHQSIILSCSNKLQFYIPEGFAHGFLVLSESAIFHYKCTNYYNPEDESGIAWNDSSLNIKWPSKSPIVSEKDSILGTFDDYCYRVL